MKRTVCLACFFCILGVGITNSAHAQFLKKLFGKKEKPRKAVPHKKTPAPSVATTQKIKPPVKQKEIVEYPQAKVKSRYRVDALVPLFLDELVKNNQPVNKTRIPEKAIPGMDFYEGLMLAADTLNALHYNVDVYVHDITDPAQSINSLINDRTLDSSDLIIGALQSHEIPQVAGFAKEHHINFISDFSPSDAGIKENPYFILMQPTLEAHCEWIVNNLAKKNTHQRVFLFYRSSVSVDESAARYITSGDSLLAVRKVLCNNPLNKKELDTLFDSVHTNLIVMSILESSFAEKLLLQLYELYPTYHFEVYGMPSWKSMPALKKPDAFPNVTVFITTPFFYDISMSKIQSLERNYKKQFAGKPSELVYRSYETLYWYAYLLSQYGTIFNTHFTDNKESPFTRFEIKPKWDKDGKFQYDENQHINLFRYQSSSYMVQQ